jgi:glutamate racemase
MGREVVLVSSADETAFEVRRLLHGSTLARDPATGPGAHRWRSSGDLAWFRDLGQQLLGPELADVDPVTWP